MAAHLDLLLRAPEMAVLDALEATLAASALALTAAHPEVEAEDFAAAPQPPSAQAALADALLTQVEGLRQGLCRYRTLVTMQEEWARHAPLLEDTAA
jgi:hypothetical protein